MRLGFDNTIKNNELLFNKWFQRKLKPLDYIFSLSRIPEIYNNPRTLLILQKEIGELLLIIQERYFLVKNGSHKNRDSSIFAYQRLMRIIRTIMDGLVWRVMGAKRVQFIVLSYNKRNQVNDDFQGLVKLADDLIAKDDRIVFLSDLTETIRIGDILTINQKGEIELFESKSFSKKVRSAKEIIIGSKKEKKQIQKLVDTQNIISSNSIDRLGVTIIDDPFMPRRYMDRLLLAIQDARKNGYSVEKLNKFMSLRVICNHAFPHGDIHENKIKSISQKAKLLIKHNNSIEDIYPAFSSMDAFYRENTHFLKGIPPFSIFPFSDDICFDLMTGELVYNVYINIEGLRSFFRDNGWESEMINSSNEGVNVEEAKEFSNFFGVSHLPDGFIRLYKKDIGYHQELNIYEFSRIGYELLMPESILHQVEFVFENSKKYYPKKYPIAINYPNDSIFFK